MAATAQRVSAAGLRGVSVLVAEIPGRLLPERRSASGTDEPPHAAPKCIDVYESEGNGTKALQRRFLNRDVCKHCSLLMLSQDTFIYIHIHNSL